MTQICDYSSLIFAGNTTVLLIIAVTTDYWEYRGCDITKIIPHLSKSTIIQSRDLVLFIPSDTNSYIKLISRKPVLVNITSNDTHASDFYHAPVFVNTRITNATTTPKGGDNYTKMAAEMAIEETHYILFQQYGNLFRDCDNLEDIESAASATALLCIVAMCIGSSCGAYALFVKYPCFPAFHVASCCSLFAGFSLTLGIALFHGKCYILRKTEIMPDLDLPFRTVLNVARQYYYGWSFCLAWVCVFFCYISSYVWLTKSQGSRRYYKLYKRSELSCYNLYDAFPENDVADVATV